MKKDYNNKIVFITGGAHGIGFSLAQIYHNLGARIVIWDINDKQMEEAKKELSNSEFFKCDVTDKDQVYQVAKQVVEKIGVPDILINNAGVVENSTFLNCPDELLIRTMNVNIMAHFWTLKAFLPSMIERKKGHICQVASAAGLIGVPGLAAYCSSKHAVIGFSDSLRLELENLCGKEIKVSVICPSFINTGMFAGVKPARFTPLLDQQKMAQIIFNAVDKDKNMVLEPFMVKTIPFLKAILCKKLFDRVLRFFRVTGAMDNILEKKTN